jgi:hypothetical protein
MMLDARVQDVRCTEAQLEVLLRDGRTICAPLAWFPRLSAASPSDRTIWEPASAGFGIHWPKVDESLSIAGLLSTGIAQ